MINLEYQADYNQRYIQSIVLPKAERRAAHERELAFLRWEQQTPSYPRHLLEAIGGLMVSAGQRLASASAPRQVSRPG